MIGCISGNRLEALEGIEREIQVLGDKLTMNGWEKNRRRIEWLASPPENGQIV
jgi:hypothetical protein